MDDRALREIALRQHGVVSRRQVLAAGGSDRTIHRQLDVGRWTRTRLPGTYVVGAAPATWHQRAMATTLAAGPDVLLSHRSAARAWGLVEGSGRMQVLVDGRRRVRLGGVEVHRTLRFDPIDRSEVDALAVTSVLRTLIDLAPTQDAPTMGALVDAAIRLHGTEVDDVAARIDALGRPGHRLPRSLTEALSLRCAGYDPGRSALESRILAALARAKLPLPLRQHEVVRADGHRAYLDLAYPPRIAIEADGWAFHGQRSAFDQDRIRANELVLLGWSVLRVTSAMSDEQICRMVTRALEREVGR